MVARNRVEGKDWLQGGIGTLGGTFWCNRDGLYLDRGSGYTTIWILEDPLYTWNWHNLSQVKHSSQVALVLKNLPANAGDVRDQVWSQGQEDPLEEGMETLSIIPAWGIPWTEEPRRPRSIGLQRFRRDWNNLARTQLNKADFKNLNSQNYSVVLLFFTKIKIW